MKIRRLFLIAILPYCFINSTTALAYDRTNTRVIPMQRPDTGHISVPTTSDKTIHRKPDSLEQTGVEPDEIDNSVTGNESRTMNKNNEPDHATKLSIKQMMLKLSPQRARMLQHESKSSARSSDVTLKRGVTGTPSGATDGKGFQAPPPEPPKYEIADCGTNQNPMICCHHEAGDGSSCNLFKILCENAGGTAQGNDESAACSDW